MTYFQVIVRVTTFSRNDQEGNSQEKLGGFDSPRREKQSYLLETDSDSVTKEQLAYIVLTKLVTQRYANVTKILYFTFDKLALKPPVTFYEKLFGHPPSAQAHLQFVAEHKGKPFLVKEQIVFKVIEREKIEAPNIQSLLTHENKAVRDFVREYQE